MPPPKSAAQLFDEAPALDAHALFDAAPAMEQSKPSLPTGSTDYLGSASKTGATLQGYAQGASLGFKDELAGAVKGLASGFSRAAIEHLAKSAPGRMAIRSYLNLPDSTPDGVVDAVVEGATQQSTPETLGFALPANQDAALSKGYRKGRDEARLEDLQASKAHPYIYGGAQLAGMASVPLPKTGGVGLARLGRVAKTGAALGAVSALGSSNADLTKDKFGGAVEDTALGAAAGGVLAPVATVAGDRLAPFLRNVSRDAAVQASMGARGRIGNALASRGYETADDARQLGQAALDMKLIRPFGTSAGVAERAGSAKQRYGARIEGVLNDADAMALPGQPSFNNSRASFDAAANVMGPSGLTTEAMSKARPAARIVDRITQQGEVDPSFRAANQLKSDIYDGISYGTEPGLSTRMQRRAAGGLRQSIEDQVAEVSGPDAADELRAANRAYGYLSDIQPLANEEATRQLQRAPWYSPGRLAAGAVSGASVGYKGGPVMGAVAGMLPVVASGLAPRIPSAVAIGAQALTPRIGGIMGQLAKPAIQAPLRPSVDEREKDAIDAFMRDGI